MKYLRHLILFFGLLCSAYPLAWMCVTAFRLEADAQASPFAFPKRWVTRNISKVFASGGFEDPWLNALLILAALCLAGLAVLVLLHIVQGRFRISTCIAIAILIAAVVISKCHPSVQEALSGKGFANAYVNSLLVCIGSVALTVALSSLAAFAFALCEFRGRNTLFVIILAGMMLPVHVTLIPLNLLMGPDFLGLKETLWALVGPYVGFALPVSILILRSAFQAVPTELLDAARIDGCSTWQVFAHVALPLARPSIATIVIFNFLTMWNEFAFALTLLGPDNSTLPIALNDFKGERGMYIAETCAALAIVVVPLMIVYGIAQKHIIRGLTAGAVKG